MRRRVAAVLMLLVLAPSCARAGDKLGAGPDVDFCTGWAEVEAFDEPAVDDRDGTLRWAEGVVRVIDRIDTREEVDDEPLPSTVKRTLKETKTAVEGFVAEADAASSTEELRAAVARFAGGDFDPAADSLTDFMVKRC